MNSMHGSDDQKLDALFRAYKDACPAPDAGVNFMPNLWARIESRQRFTFSFRRIANALTTAAVATSLALGLYMSIPRSNSGFSSRIPPPRKQAPPRARTTWWRSTCA